MPYWNETILPRLKSGERVIIAAHGNSLRALVKYLDNMGEDEIPRTEHPDRRTAGIASSMKTSPIKHYYLGNAEEIAAKAAAVAKPG